MYPHMALNLNVSIHMAAPMPTSTNVPKRMPMHQSKRMSIKYSIQVQAHASACAFTDDHAHTTHMFGPTLANWEFLGKGILWTGPSNLCRVCPRNFLQVPNVPTPSCSGLGIVWDVLSDACRIHVANPKAPVNHSHKPR